MRFRFGPRLAPVMASLLCLGPAAVAQEVFSEMPRFDRYQRLARDIANANPNGGRLVITWAEDSTAFGFDQDGKSYVYTLATRSKAEGKLPTRSSTPARTRPRGTPERGRQFAETIAPDGKVRAFVRDNNVFLSQPDGSAEQPLTTEGSVANRQKYGVASWVYGEELNVREAMWFSPDSKTLAYYHFDERPVLDYWLVLDQTKFQGRLDTEAYPKAGTANPVVRLVIHPLEGRPVTVDTSFGDATLGEYVYSVRWSEDGKELFYNRTNRKQNVMQFCAADARTGKSRVIAEERQPQSWAENHPDVRWLADGQRFLWSSEQSGFKNWELRHRDGRRLNAVTNLRQDVGSILRLDEASGEIWYTAQGPENPYYLQVYRGKLDGTGHRLLTDPKLHHTVSISPDGKWLIDTVQTPTSPPETRLLDADGKLVEVLAKADRTKFDARGLRTVVPFTCLAADGKTEIYGHVAVPSDFDPAQKYPAIFSVYAGPESGGLSPDFAMPSPITELGFLVVQVRGRGSMGRGKAFRDAVYGRLGVVEIDDIAAAAKHLAATYPYFDAKRVGIYGTSYGGYASIMAILRHPDVFRVACASSSVTDWRHYDTIYTERYMGLPDAAENKRGYDEGSAIPLAKNLKGHLHLFFGTAENNVHPSNTYQLIAALDAAGRRYDMSVGPDRGHVQMNSSRMWEYFIKHLILQPNTKPQASLWSPRTRLGR